MLDYLKKNLSTMGESNEAEASAESVDSAAVNMIAKAESLFREKKIRESFAAFKDISGRKARNSFLALFSTAPETFADGEIENAFINAMEEAESDDDYSSQESIRLAKSNLQQIKLRQVSRCNDISEQIRDCNSRINSLKSELQNEKTRLGEAVKAEADLKTELDNASNKVRNFKGTKSSGNDYLAYTLALFGCIIALVLSYRGCTSYHAGAGFAWLLLGVPITGLVGYIIGLLIKNAMDTSAKKSDKASLTKLQKSEEECKAAHQESVNARMDLETTVRSLTYKITEAEEELSRIQTELDNQKLIARKIGYRLGSDEL